jgi:hypothetical protein
VIKPLFQPERRIECALSVLRAAATPIETLSADVIDTANQVLIFTLRELMTVEILECDQLEGQAILRKINEIRRASIL